MSRERKYKINFQVYLRSLALTFIFFFVRRNKYCECLSVCIAACGVLFLSNFLLLLSLSTFVCVHCYIEMLFVLNKQMRENALMCDDVFRHFFICPEVLGNAHHTSLLSVVNLENFKENFVGSDEHAYY